MLMYEFLVGNPPFEAQTHNETYKRISKVDLKFPAHVSPLARDLLQKVIISKKPKFVLTISLVLLLQLLVKDSSKRITLPEVLKHPWVAANLSTSE